MSILLRDSASSSTLETTRGNRRTFTKSKEPMRKLVHFRFGDTRIDFSDDNLKTERKNDTVLPTEQSEMRLLTIFRCQKYEYAVPQPPVPDRANISPDENYTPVFLSHARLYVLVDTYLVRPLCDLALHKLQYCLTKYLLSRGRPGDIVNLIRYAYASTRGLGAGPLRTLVAQYAAKEVKDKGKET